jgi:hypothetical protein
MRRILLGIVAVAVTIAGVVFWPHLAGKLTKLEMSDRQKAENLLLECKWKQAEEACDALINQSSPPGQRDAGTEAAGTDAASTEKASTAKLDGELYFWRGRARLGAGNRQGAVDDLTIAIEQSPDEAEPRYYRSRAYELLGMTDRAELDRREAQQRDPNFRLQALEEKERLAAEMHYAQVATNSKADIRVVEQREARKEQAAHQSEASKSSATASTPGQAEKQGDAEPSARSGLQSGSPADATVDAPSDRAAPRRRLDSLASPSVLDVLTQSGFPGDARSRDGDARARDGDARSRDTNGDAANDPLSLKPDSRRSPFGRSSLAAASSNARRLTPESTGDAAPSSHDARPKAGAKPRANDAADESADDPSDAPPPRQTSTAMDAPGMYPYPSSGLIGPAIPQLDSPAGNVGIGGFGLSGGSVTTGYAGNLSGAAIGPVTYIGQSIPSIVPQASQRTTSEASSAQAEPAQSDLFGASRYPIQRWTAPTANPLARGAMALSLARNSRGESNSPPASSAGIRAGTAGGPAAHGGFGGGENAVNPMAENPVARILHGPQLYGPSLTTPNVAGYYGAGNGGRMPISAASVPAEGGLSTASAPLARPVQSAAAVQGPRQGAFSTESQPLPVGPQSSAVVDLQPGQQPLSLPNAPR